MDETYALIVEIRGAFADLRALSDRMNAHRGITAARRAILEHLADHGPATVPDIAAAKQVTRQHVQTIADDLVAQGLATFRDNPAHRRSHLVALTAAGSDTFAAIRGTETRLLARLAERLPQGTAANGLSALRAFRAGLAEIEADDRPG
jgi:DNA-binding MarR family transcriptional regulator